MRIRKNAKISPLLYAAAAVAAASLNPETLLQTHICQLNQSPWDVMNFSPPSSPPPSPAPFQVHGNANYAGNVSSQDSISVPKRSSNDRELELRDDSMKWEYPGEDTTPKAEEFGGDTMKDGAEISMCGKTDGKSWRCRREAAKDNSLCDHHLSMVRSYNNSAHISSKLSMKSAADNRRHPRIKKSASTSSTNPYVFYYYSGFGPRWAGKRRGEDGGGPKNTAIIINGDKIDQSDTEASNNIFDDELEEEEDDDIKKKARKRVKARSLKSLM